MNLRIPPILRPARSLREKEKWPKPFHQSEPLLDSVFGNSAFLGPWRSAKPARWGIFRGRNASLRMPRSLWLRPRDVPPLGPAD